MPDAGALEGRVTRLENAVTNGFERIEGLLRQEINDLKTEQIKDLREANNRLADDQRRLWDQVTELQRRDYQRIGSGRTIGAITNIMSAVFGGSVAALVAYFTTLKPHP